MLGAILVNATLWSALSNAWMSARHDGLGLYQEKQKISAACNLINLNRNRYTRKFQIHYVVPFHQRILGSTFQQANARQYIIKSVQDFFPAQQIQLLVWPAYLPDMSPTEHVWDFVGYCRCHACAATSTAKLWARKKKSGMLFLNYRFKKSLIRCHAEYLYLLQRMMALPNPDFRHVILFFWFCKFNH